MKALLGKKLGMTQILDDEGSATAVTLIQAGPCTVTQVKTSETDGYDAVQIGFGKAKHVSKPLTGHLKSAKVSPRYIREIRDVEFDKEATKIGSSLMYRPLK